MRGIVLNDQGQRSDQRCHRFLPGPSDWFGVIHQYNAGCDATCGTVTPISLTN